MGWAGGEALCELAPWYCSAERLLGGGLGGSQRAKQTLSWGCHAVSEGPQLAWLPNAEHFCNMLLTVSSCQIWGSNQKHRFSTLRRKPECSSVQTDPEAALPYGMGCWECFMNRFHCAHQETPCSGHLN